MAVLSVIRQRFGWVMVGLIAVAMGGFLFMDFAGGNRGNVGMNSVGRVNGKKISVEKMEDAIKEMKTPLAEEARANAWNQVVVDMLVDEQVEALGILVTESEMGELFVGKNISPVVGNELADPNTGAIDRNAIRNALTEVEGLQMNEQNKPAIDFWTSLKKRVHRQRLTSKYSALIRQAIYTPTWLAGADYARDNQTFDLAYVRIPYSAVPNDQVKVTDDELNAYIKENAHKFEREAVANIEFAIFNILPSPQDSAAYWKKMNELAVEFQAITAVAQDSSFVIREDGSLPFQYFAADDMDEPAALKDSIFAAAKGTMFGPYLHNNSLKLIKIMDTKELADSVQYRRILFPVNMQDQAAFNAAVQLTDSLKTLLREGKANFADLVNTHSADPKSKAVGGDMGFVARNLQPGGMGENDFYFFEAKQDSLYTLRAPEGGIQIVQVTGYKLNGKKGVRLGIVAEPIIPSDKTVKEVSAQAYNFIQKNRTLDQFKEAVRAGSLPAGVANGLEPFAYEIGALGKSGEVAAIVRWAHTDAKEKEVANSAYAINDENLNYTRQFVVPVLTSRSPKGLASLADDEVRAEVDRAVRNKKKAEIIRQAVKGNNSLDAIAAQYTLQVESAKSITYAVPFMNGTSEPKVAAVADLLTVGTVSAPISTRDAVFVINVVSKMPAPPATDMKTSIRQMSQRSAQAILNLLIEAFKKNATIEDNRAQVYN